MQQSAGRKPKKKTLKQNPLKTLYFQRRNIPTQLKRNKTLKKKEDFVEESVQTQIAHRCQSLIRRKWKVGFSTNIYLYKYSSIYELLHFDCVSNFKSELKVVENYYYY